MPSSSATRRVEGTSTPSRSSTHAAASTTSSRDSGTRAAALAWRGGYRAALATSGNQEAMVLAKGGYTPDVIVVEHGKPVRLSFRREETAACSELVILNDFGKSAHLPEGEIVPLEFLPERPGEYAFTCQMGMLRGTVVVE